MTGEHWKDRESLYDPQKGVAICSYSLDSEKSSDSGLSDSSSDGKLSDSTSDSRLREQ